MRKALLMVTAAVAVLLFGVAWADAAPTATHAAMHDPNGWSSVVILAAMAITWALRNYTAPESWAHKPLWALSSSVLGGIGSAVPTAIADKGLSKETLLTCVVGVFMIALGQSKPVGKDGSGGGLATILAFLLLGSSACAPGADGLRQACTVTETVLASAYQTTATLSHARRVQLQSELGPSTVERIRTAWNQVETSVQKVLTGLDAASDTTHALCALIPAVEAGQRKDVASLIAQLTQVGADVTKAIAEVKTLFARALLSWRFV